MELKSVINSYIYFYHLDKFCVLPDYPETVTDSMQSDFGSTNALARTAPVFSYLHSGPRTVNINLTLHRDLMNDLNRNVSNLKENVVDFSDEDYIDTLIKYIQSINLPKYNEYSSSAKVVVPPMIAVRFGNDIFVKGVVSNLTVTYHKPILINDKYAVVDLQFAISEVDPYDADSVVQQGSFRGITGTFKNGIYEDTYSSITFNSKNTSTSSNVESHPEGITTSRRQAGKIPKNKPIPHSSTRSSGQAR